MSKVDVILSSGFLGFAYHTGFLSAIHSANLKVEHLMGTSSGALVGALYCAGYPIDFIKYEITKYSPISMATIFPISTTGLLNMDPLIKRISKILPRSFDNLKINFSCGVVDNSGCYRLLNAGSLPEAICASMAIPYLFKPVEVSGVMGGPFFDGGVKYRVGYEPWRQSLKKETNKTLIHLIENSYTLMGKEENYLGLDDVLVFHSPRSHESFIKLKKFQHQFLDAELRIGPQLNRINNNTGIPTHSSEI
ncbi:patatin-like phospholipase family protein (plasmid) [Edwardsiella tarda]|uniref:patatin-like phospholipase family protein n=1 Tax=Edwardsiella tarda TaxID=636 RepID=UPI002444A681|nr:patatin-like phospholipase family protein [Edwardsiella tarda]WGE30841.1 patatin-like phospholipase family protein [Edwardsiella tarda]